MTTSLGVNTAGIEVNGLITPQRPIAGTAVVTTANTSYADTGLTNTVVITFGSSASPETSFTKGARITRLIALARATNTATELQLFVSKDGGTTKRFIDSALGAAYTVAQTTKQAKIDFGFSETSPLILDIGESLYAATGVTNTGWVFRAEGGAYV